MAIPLDLTSKRLYNRNMSQAFKLYRLQQIDSQLDQIQSRLSSIERMLKDDTRLRAALEYTQETEKRRKESQKSLRRIEEEVNNQRIKIEQTEATLYSGKVRNPKELQDLQNEAASLKRYVNVLEDRQFEAMIVLEQAENDHQAATLALEDLHSDRTIQNTGLTNEQTSLRKDVERFGLERQATISSISQEDLQLYEQLRQQRRGVAVARVTDSTCAACGSTLTPAVIQAAASSIQLARCSFCGRILYPG